ncbi:MAG: hypothetical protein ACLFV5_10950 [Anaerolineales bacterium]
MKIKTGMLWFDNTKKRSFDAKVERATQHYKEKYRRSPDICYVHPSCLPGDVPSNGVEILAAEDILPHHFWLGMTEKKETAE